MITKRHFSLLAALGALCLSGCTQSFAQGSCDAARNLTAQERIASRHIQERIDSSLEAFAAKDMSALTAELPADFTLKTIEGTVLDRAQIAEGMRHELASVLAVSDDTYTHITCLSLRGSQATVMTEQHYVRMVPDRKDGSPHEIITNVTHREIWVYTEHGWRTKHVDEVVQGPTLLDGEPYNPN
jgi:hypothetical protein